MIQMFRKELKSWNIVWWFVLLALAAQYLVLRAPREGRDRIVASVNGQKVTVADLRRGVAQERFRRELYALYTRIPLTTPINPAVVFQTVINQTLVDQQADTLGVRVSDRTITEELAKSLGESFLTREGGINMPAYTDYLRRLGISVSDFEMEHAGNLSRGVVRQAVFESAEAPGWMVQERFDAQYNSKKYALVTLSRDTVASEIAKNEINDEELRAFYQKNQEKYRIPEQRKARYLEISSKDFAAKMAISDEEVERYYEKNKATTYKNPAKVAVRQIVLNKPVNASADELVAVRSRAEALLKEVQQAPETFAAVAKKSSEDSATASKGGSTGFIIRGQIPRIVEQAAYRLQEENQLSDLIDAPRAFYILQLEKREKATEKPLSEVRAEVIKAIRSGKSPGKLKTLVQGAVRQGKKDLAALDSFAKEQHLSWKETAFMAANEVTGGRDGLSQLVRALFNRGNKEGSVASVATADGIILYHISGLKKSVVPVFNEVKDRVKKDLVDELSRAELKKRARAGHAALLAGENLETWASAHGYSLRKTEALTREKARKSFKDMGDLADRLVLLSDASQVLRYNDGKNYYLAKLVESGAAAASDEKNLNEVRSELVEDLKEATMTAFIASLERNAKIVSDETNIAALAQS